MMVRVVNRNTFDHSEKFRGEMITIKSGGYIEMEREDGVLFRSQFTTPKYNKGGVQTEASKKKIHLEPIVDAIKVPEISKSKDTDCQACGESFKSAAGLASHIRAKHPHLMVDSEARDKLLEEG